MKTTICMFLLPLLLLTGVTRAAEGDAEITFDTDYETITTKPALLSRDTTEVIIGAPTNGNYIPFWGSVHDAMRFQVLFLQSEINTLGDIVTFSWNPSTSDMGTFNNVRVYMCHTSATQLVSTFDNNYTGNTPVELINVPSMLVGGPADQWWDWDVYFPYNNVDNLLVEVRWNGDAGLGIPMWRTTEVVERRLWAPDDNASTGTLQFTGNYVRLYLTPPAGATFWDFETGWQGWTHTNGQVFPAAWGVQPSGIHGACPDPGDSSMWIDSDATGVGGVADTALSPVVVPPAGMQWLKYGYFNYGGSGSWIDELRAGIKHFTSGAWNVVELAYYPAGVVSGPAWDSVDVSAYAAADSVQVYFFFDDLGTWGYYAAFDNVGLYAPAAHDVGCSAILSPPEGTTPAADYDVIGRIRNYGGSMETFDVTANVYDTVGMVNVFTQTVTLTDFPVAGDSNVNFGTVTFNADSYYYTVIYTMLSGDSDPSNDTSAIYSTTAISPGDVIFELDAETITGDIRLVGVEFDGEYFYVTGATDGVTATMVYVIDTAGNLVGSDNQAVHSTGWGWRDIAWDYAYRGPDRIDTLYSSVNNNVDKWGYDFVGDSMIYYGSFLGPQNPNRALAYDGDDGWFFTATFANPCYKFSKTNPNIQSVPNTWAIYGAAYDAGHPTTDGPWVWWHSQDNPGTGYSLMIHQMDPVTMAFTGYFLAPVPTMSATGTAGGLCYWSDFRGMDVLFGLNQGTPDHIFGVFVRMTPTGIEEELGVTSPLVFGFAPMINPTRNQAVISYHTTKPGMVSLKVYDRTGRLVKTLVNNTQNPGTQTVTWDARNMSNGVYFLRLEADNQTAVHKLILVK